MGFNLVTAGMLGYLFLFVSAVPLIAVWLKKRRNVKPPLEFKLLRGPGESLRRKMAAFDENIFFWLVGPVLFLLFIFGSSAQLIVWFGKSLSGNQQWLLVMIPTLIATFFAGRFMIRGLFRYSNDRLGYLGERAVGEALEPLMAQGYRVFHDVPAEAGGHTFNVDHVAVGSNGVFAIETKTRRKGRVRPGFEAHKVISDGRQLVWP